MSQDSSDTGTSPPAPPGSSIPESGAGNKNDKDSPAAPSPDSTLPSPPPPNDNSNKQPSSPSSDKKPPEAPPPPETPAQEKKSPPLPPPSTSEAPPVPQTPKQQTPAPPQTQSSSQQQSQPAPDSHSKKSPPSTSSPSLSESSSADSFPSSSDSNSDSSDDSTKTSPSSPSPSPSPGTSSAPSSSNSTSSSSSSPSPSSSSALANGFSTPSSSSSPKALGPPTPTTYETPNPNSNDGSSGSGSSNNNTQSNVSSSTTTSSSHAKNPNYQSAVAVTVVVGVLVVVFIVVFFYLRDRKKKQQDSSAGSNMPLPPPANYTIILDGQTGESPGLDAVHGQPCTTANSPQTQRGPDSGIMAGPKTYFSYEELIEMTDGFSCRNVIGEGGFGCVYKGRMPDGRVVAVKQLKAGGGQGEREFRAEVEIISRVHHKHLVSLVGYSTAENQRLLIYEFVPNRTLEHHLHGKDLPVLEWSKRIKIALGAAKGLAYLHEDCHPKIIHRDIKSANILLEENFDAKVADFGLARLNDATQSQTHVSTRVMGTFGYLAPEYASSGKLTDRSDVYSFGVVLLELITGRKPIDSTRPLGDESLVEWARPLLIQALETGDYSELIDSRLENRYEEREIIRMIEAAAACVRHSFSKRPHMALVVRSLDFEGDPDLSNGVKYGDSTAYDSGKYSEEIMQFRQMAFSSTENSSERYNSREVSGGGQSSWNSQYSSGDYTSGELETRALRPDSGEHRGGSRNHKSTGRFS
ncbi:hypothetical protein HRI_002446700 [Hibiscus trionum]|uniref:non-specific serine/threonine protein kinase n=1 Tax=Hibiscus trionum TaxID=183268 RepID=A0A9W7I1U8_HIBTR|nr:hypothetical protein HRI_002446700 [Hibiscus trionum]